MAVCHRVGKLSREARYPGGPDRIEVIIADNGSTDETPKLARAAGW